MYTKETSFDACTDFPPRVNPQVMEAVEILPEACFTEKKRPSFILQVFTNIPNKRRD
ncbi:hypothetical protein RV14_GL001075 [Enterococcus ratti]|uniref:Uncharacterized protein n=1 Tax=Enterococcus ratti TaxID=150033 RepID=A0A1L8WD05_9ENTE|nr:hypothetical protein RV14_GL001075 [Enterococcus ratti]